MPNISILQNPFLRIVYLDSKIWPDAFTGAQYLASRSYRGGQMLPPGSSAASIWQDVARRTSIGQTVTYLAIRGNPCQDLAQTSLVMRPAPMALSMYSAGLTLASGQTAPQLVKYSGTVAASRQTSPKQTYCHELKCSLTISRTYVKRFET